MEPVLRPGDEVLIDTRTKPRVGDIVVARHPFRTDVQVIKRIVGFDAAGRAELRGDNPQASSDSRTLGAFGPELLLGRVSSRLPANTTGQGEGEGGVAC